MRWSSMMLVMVVGCGESAWGEFHASLAESELATPIDLPGAQLELQVADIDGELSAWVVADGRRWVSSVPGQFASLPEAYGAAIWRKGALRSADVHPESLSELRVGQEIVVGSAFLYEAPFAGVDTVLWVSHVELDEDDGAVHLGMGSRVINAGY